MSTPTSMENPAEGLATSGTIPSALLDEGITQPVATRKVTKLYLFALALAQFGLFFALLAPIYVSLSLKAQQIAPNDPSSIVGSVLSVGAFGALFANPLAGALSDRTRTRWGRRRPWMVGGTIVFVGSLAWMAFGHTRTDLMLAWLLAQVSANAVFSAMTASFADNVPEIQRGRASSLIGLAQNVSALAGLYLAVYLAGNIPVLFIAPGIFAIAVILFYSFIVKDELPTHKLKRFTLLNIVSSFWTNPFKHRDFGFAWWGRFLIIFGTYMFTTYRLLYMEDRIGLGATAATAAVAFGVLLYTIALLVSTAISGWASDRLQRRKVFVWTSTALTAVGLIVLAHSTTIGSFYTAEVIMGFAFGAYLSIDTALVVDVLPNADRPGKDLGVLNIANALPQSLAPAFGLFLLHVGSSAGGNYTLMLWGAGIAVILGALAIFPIKSVR
ncbi:MFS transporter [Frondihabitans australicus]|uniref:MFS transporter n=1 Tax=Frondihabitans australicus TaxID=386892 RepID=A0A495IH53_9MICO|nr:MFS transporter [Frondihabitans australicus]RKR75284.1 MFS transporter [Frondihabitans australicus]